MAGVFDVFEDEPIVDPGNHGFFPPWCGPPRENPGKDTFCVQTDPIGRAKCYKCKEVIQAGSIRFGVWTPRFCSIAYSIWRFRHLGCVTPPEIRAAIQRYGSVEGIPTRQDYFIPSEDRQECNESLSSTLLSSEMEREGEESNEAGETTPPARKQPVAECVAKGDATKKAAAKPAVPAAKKPVAKKPAAKKPAAIKKTITKKKPVAKKAASTKKKAAAKK